jgi:hypothetical protein
MDSQRPAAAVLDLGGGFLYLFDSSGRRHNISAGVRETMRDGAADTGRTADDDSYFP